MRTSSLLLSASAGALIACGVTVGTAYAQPAVPAVPATVSPAVPSQPGVAEPGAVSTSVSQAAPGQTVRVSGTCPTPPAGAPMPTVQSVTSPAFAGPESFSKTDPMAFDGTATIASSATAGTHPVTLTCSNGTASTSITVTGGGGGPTPTPTPAHHGGSTAGGTTDQTTTGGDQGTVDTTTVAPQVQTTEGGLPWGWIAAGAVVVLGGGAGVYAATRRRGAADPGDGADAPTERLHR